MPDCTPPYENPEFTLEKFGYSVAFVPVDKSPVDAAYAYSTGLQENFAHPEIIIFGLMKTLAVGIAKTVCEHVRKGCRLSPGEQIDGLFDSGDPVLITDLPAGYARERLAIPCGSSDLPFEAVQIHLPRMMGPLDPASGQLGTPSLLPDTASQWEPPTAAKLGLHSNHTLDATSISSDHQAQLLTAMQRGGLLDQLALDYIAMARERGRWRAAVFGGPEAHHRAGPRLCEFMVEEYLEVFGRRPDPGDMLLVARDTDRYDPDMTIGDLLQRPGLLGGEASVASHWVGLIMHICMTCFAEAVILPGDGLDAWGERVDRLSALDPGLIAEWSQRFIQDWQDIAISAAPYADFGPVSENLPWHNEPLSLWLGTGPLQRLQDDRYIDGSILRGDHLIPQWPAFPGLGDINEGLFTDGAPLVFLTDAAAVQPWLRRPHGAASVAFRRTADCYMRSSDARYLIEELASQIMRLPKFVEDRDADGHPCFALDLGAHPEPTTLRDLYDLPFGPFCTDTDDLVRVHDALRARLAIHAELRLGSLAPSTLLQQRIYAMLEESAVSFLSAIEDAPIESLDCPPDDEEFTDNAIGSPGSTHDRDADRRYTRRPVNLDCEWSSNLGAYILVRP